MRVEGSQIYSTLKIVPAMPLPPFERGGLPFAYSLYDVLFLICSKMFTDLLEIFQVQKLIFSKPIFSISYHFLLDYVADCIKRLWNLPLHISIACLGGYC